MEMIRHQSPGIDNDIAILAIGRYAIDKVFLSSEFLKISVRSMPLAMT
jgi:hypothetical protein